MQTYGPRTPPERVTTLSIQNKNRRSSSEISYMQTPSLSYDGTEYDEPSPGRLSQNLSPRALLDEYTKSGLRVLDHEQAPMILRRTSTLHDEDPITAHYLVETAIDDSQDFKILSYDELHNLKKEKEILLRRIQGVRRNLHLESKVRSAAQSLNRLERKRRGSEARGALGARTSVSLEQRDSSGTPIVDPFSQVSQEAAASTRKCEDLALDLWKLERRLAQLRDKQLQHTAAVLHMEHLFRSREGSSPQPSALNGTSHEYANNNHALDRSTTPEEFLNMIDGTNSKPSKYHSELIRVTEKRVERLQERLRELMDLISSQSRSVDASDFQRVDLPFTPAPTLEEGLDNMDSGFTVLEQKISNQLAKTSVDAIETKISDLNQQLYTIINSSRSRSENSYPPPPTQNESVDNPTRYLEDGLSSFKSLHTSLTNELDLSHTREIRANQEYQQTNTTLNRLWETVKASEEAAIQRKLKEGDQAANELTVPNEPFSVEAFSGKIQRLCNQTSALADQHSVLRQQINQQREAHSAREKERSDLLTKIQSMTDKHSTAQRDLDDTKASHAETGLRLAEAQREIARHREQLDANAAALAGQHDTSAQLVKLQSEHENLKSEHTRLQTDLNSTRTNLQIANSTCDKQANDLAANKERLADLDSLRTLSNSQGMKLKAAEERVEVLQRELKSLVGEYEGLVKLSVEGEKEREGLESSIDALREKCEALEVSRSEELVQSIAQKQLPSTNGVAPPGSTGKEGTSMSVMKSEFKKMMRDARAEHFKHLKIEQDERRRLEGVIRNLRKEHTTTLSASSPPLNVSNIPSAGPPAQASTIKSGLSNALAVG